MNVGMRTTLLLPPAQDSGLVTDAALPADSSVGFASPSASPGRAAGANPEHYLVERWRPLAYAIASHYYLAGGDRDDVRQEALIGLVNGIRSWRTGHAASYSTFLALCIRRQIVTAVKTAARRKHVPLNTAMRGSVTVDDDEVVDLLDTLPAPQPDPYDALVLKTELRAVCDAVAAMTPLQRESVAVVANDLPYHGNKSIDNGLQKARRKLRAALEAA